MTRKKAPAPTLSSLRLQLRRFAEARDWGQFHTPKNLAMALSVEAAELLECFQWLTAEQSARPGAAEQRAIEEEMADVLLYLLRLSDVLGVDLPRAAQRKMAINARKYPVALARGNARKYSQR
jgi:dCTP diphosphatase